LRDCDCSLLADAEALVREHARWGLAVLAGRSPDP
jgi:hypothetical protein